MGTLWYGGQIYTLEAEYEKVEAVYVENGMIEAVGDYQTLLAKFKHKVEKKINLQGNTMIPGLVDSHLHLIGHGEKLLRLDFSDMNSSEEILQAIQRKIPFLNKNEWIIGEGWNENQLTDRKIIHRTELDLIAPDHPVLLKRICRHAVIVNSKALALAGITSDTLDPSDGVIVRDHDGTPTGYLLDGAQELIFQVTPNVSADYLKNALKTSIEDCYEKGLVGGHSEDLAYYGDLEKTLTTFEEVVNHNRKFRTNLLAHHSIIDELHSKNRNLGLFVELGAMKIFADGALGGRTALLSSQYKDDPETNGVAIHAKQELVGLVRKARSYKMEVAIHVIGDLAFEWALDAITICPPQPGQNDRLIHAQILREDLIERMIGLPIVLDIQPRFVASDFPWILDRIDEKKIKYCYAWKTLLEKGIACAGGSDAPIEPVDPLLGIHAAVTRKSMYDNITYYPEQCLSVFEAVELFTKGSAVVIHKENERGIIKEGYVADFTVFNKDIFTIPHEEILTTKVSMTVVDNTVMYENISRQKQEA
ncbi:amidohydrolase [Metabacillus herbersteinensis]|uniref:Amidohydrolase n=1 Tax=Metabacillus herbersteinensis TaxID=283816 RepID=A0ABV6G9E4_9BACI